MVLYRKCRLNSPRQPTVCYKCSDAVINATTVHSLQQKTTPNPLFSTGLTSCVSSQFPPPGHMCQPHLCGRGLRQCPANQPHAVWGTVNDRAWRRFAVHWLPAKHFPRHTATAKVGRPLAQDPSHRQAHSGSTSP